VFAATEKHLLAAVGGVFDRFKACVFVGAIAEWLALGLTACTPEIAFALDHLDRIGLFLRDGWVV